MRNQTRHGLLMGVALFLSGCGDGPVSPPAPALEIVVAGGDLQFGQAGESLGAPLLVQVRRSDSGTPREGVSVVWNVEAGDATLLTSPTTVTDSTGVAEARLRLGTAAGTVEVRAALHEQEEIGALFTAFLVEKPVLSALSSDAVRGGDTIQVDGANFSPVGDHNVVLFDGIRGKVVEATTGRLTVEVPSCLPGRDVDVTAQLGSLVSDPLGLAVTDGGQTVSIARGSSLDVDDPKGLTCLRLSGGAGYLAVVQSASTVGAAQHDFVLRGLAASGAPTLGVSRSAGGSPSPLTGRNSFATRFETELRRREQALVRAADSPQPVPPPRAPARIPTVGERRTFQVLNAAGGFDQVEAVAQFVSSQAVLYVDEAAPAGGLTLSDLAFLAFEFDEVIHPTITGSFGSPSDLDANERIAILFTPVVNSLTARGASGFVGGFFYGLDLLDREGSNRAEVFYALVPDPSGEFSDARPKDLVLDVTPAILAHEFQHMIHFNERVLKLEAETTEALWLSEGLAQMAEELVALAFESFGNTAAVERYRKGNRVRARRYLAAPERVSLIVATGAGTLEERGAGWLHLLYLWDREGLNVLRRLTATTRTGVDNVTAQVGRPWPELLSDWLAALYSDGQGVSSYSFEYPTVDLRTLLKVTGGAYPLTPEVLGSSDFARTGSLWSSSGGHYIVVPPSGGFVAVRLAGADGGNASEDALLRLRVVRLF